MTLDELKKIALDAVNEHGRDGAIEVLQDRSAKDDAFKMACADHGYNIFCATVESIGAVKHK